MPFLHFRSAACRLQFRSEPISPTMIRLDQIMVSSIDLRMIFSENRVPLFRIMLWPIWAENAGLLTGRCHLRYCGMTLKRLNFHLW
jgi:hypothetical protein